MFDPLSASSVGSVDQNDPSVGRFWETERLRVKVKSLLEEAGGRTEEVSPVTANKYRQRARKSPEPTTGMGLGEAVVVLDQF